MLRLGRIEVVITLSAAVLLMLEARPGCPLNASTPKPAAEGAQAYLEQLRASTGTPAVSGAVAFGGRVVFSGGAGMIDLENQVPATGSSVYNIGSLSKSVTAIAVMQLVEERRVSLDDDVRSYVTEFPDKGAKITIRHLLTHTSGIRHYHPFDFPGTPDNENIQPVASWKDGLRFFAADPLLFPPGRYFHYSSYAVNLLQGVVETASHETFETYLREHIWKRAGMASASLDIPERIMPHRARSYRIDHGVHLNYYYNDLRYKFASGGMIASVEDLAKLGAALNHDLLLRPETRATMLSPQIEGLQEFREGAAPEAIDFEEECKSIHQHCQGAMLWRVRRDPEGRRVAYECGSVKGFNACLVDFLDEDLVAAIATNSFECCGWVKADALAALFRPHGRREGPQRFPRDATPSAGQTVLLRAATEKRERGPV